MYRFVRLFHLKPRVIYDKRDRKKQARAQLANIGISESGRDEYLYRYREEQTGIV